MPPLEFFFAGAEIFTIKIFEELREFFEVLYGNVRAKNFTELGRNTNTRELDIYTVLCET